MQKNKIKTTSITQYNINSKWFRDLIVKPEILKVLDYQRIIANAL
jgi:hypothetical protein